MADKANTQKSVKPNAVRTVANALRKLAVTKADGELMGSEEELAVRFNVSRPTLRNAAAILVQEQLLKVRRGVRGGYFACHPSATAVQHIAAIYLQAHGTTPEEVIRSVPTIFVELVRLAALNKSDTKRRAELRKWLDKEMLPEKTQESDLYDDFVRSEREFAALLEDLANNDVLRLFFSIIDDFCVQLRPPGLANFRHGLDRIAILRKARQELARAILERDEELAVLIAKRFSAQVTAWYMEYVGLDAAKSTIQYVSTARKAGRRAATT
jgi:DNA-binding FadR family transcriptional regulator